MGIGLKWQTLLYKALKGPYHIKLMVGKFVECVVRNIAHAWWLLVIFQLKGRIFGCFCGRIFEYQIWLNNTALVVVLECPLIDWIPKWKMFFTLILHLLNLWTDQDVIVVDQTIFKLELGIKLLSLVTNDTMLWWLFCQWSVYYRIGLVNGCLHFSLFVLYIHVFVSPVAFWIAFCIGLILVFFFGHSFLVYTLI